MAEAMTQTGPILILTRPRDAARRFVAQLGAQMAVPVDHIISPLIEIEPLKPDLPEAPFSGLIFTSENGVRAAARLGLARGLRCYAVGEQTARAARAAGFAPTCADGDAAALIALILSAGDSGPLLHLRGEHVRGDVAARLTADGVLTVELIAYRQIARPLQAAALIALAGLSPVVLPLFSARTVSIMANLGPFTAPLRVIAISHAVADAATMLGSPIITVADRPDGRAMLRATIAALNGGAVLEAGGTNS